MHTSVEQGPESLYCLIALNASFSWVKMSMVLSDVLALHSVTLAGELVDKAVLNGYFTFALPQPQDDWYDFRKRLARFGSIVYSEYEKC